MRNRLVPKWMTLTLWLEVVSRSRQPLHYIWREYLGNRYIGTLTGNGIGAIKWSHDRWLDVTWPPKVWDSTVGSPSDSLASCFVSICSLDHQNLCRPSNLQKGFSFWGTSCPPLPGICLGPHWGRGLPSPRPHASAPPGLLHFPRTSGC